MKLKQKLVVLALLASAGFVRADTYDPATNQITIPSITIGGTTFRAVVTVASVVSFNTGTPGTATTWDPATSVLSIPSIVVAGMTFTNVRITIGSVVSASIVSVTPPAAAASCSTTTAPAGMNYSQSGNTVTVTTNGCITIPTAGICNPTAAQATGVNVLVTQNTQSFTMTGITMNIPGLPNPFESAASAMGAFSSCIRNAPTGYSSLTINTNVCYDLTQQMAPLLTASPSPYITVSSPITMSMTGTTTMQTVADCTTTGAAVIVDAFTGQALTKQADGSYK